MTKERPPLTPLGDILTELFRSGSLPINPEDARIWEVWENVVGTHIARYARPSWIRQGRLRVEVSDPIWLQELRFVGEDIRGRLNRQLDRDAVSKLEFRLASR